jgi:hypothetical protein
MRVNHRRFDEGVARLLLDGEDMSTADQHVGGERMSEQVRPDAFTEARAFSHDTDQFAKVLRPVRIALLASGAVPVAMEVLIQHPDPETKVILKSNPIDLSVMK